MTRDAALGGILLAVAAGYYRLATAIPDSQLADAVGPSGLPVAYAAVLGMLSLVLVVRGLRARAGASEFPPPTTMRTVARAAGMLALGALYVFAAPLVGYPVAIAGLLIGTAYYQGGRIDRRVLLVGFVGAVVLWALFVLLLGVRQPEGVWGIEGWVRGS